MTTGSDSDPDLVMALTYYAPYVSGLTNAAKTVAEGLVERGWRVTVVASQHEPTLAPQEVVDGVRVVRTPVIARLSKGVVSPLLPVIAAREIRRAGLGNLHLPMPEAGPTAALVGRNARLIVTYQCDVTLPPSTPNRVIERLIDASSRSAIRRASAVGVSSRDYLSSSRLQSAISSKAVAIAPPSLERPHGSPSYREGTGTHIGFLGRIVEEKGIPYLVRAFRDVAGADWRLLIGGDYERVAGGSVVANVRQAAADDPRIRLLGFIPDSRMADFYASIDIFAFPSVNSLEAFGIAQVEAMFSGVPVVASALPGVRQPVLETGFGRIVPPRDVSALGDALAEVAAAPREAWEGAEERARTEYSLTSILDRWEQVLSGEGSRPTRR